MSSINAAIGANRRIGLPLKFANAIPVSNRSASAEIVSHVGTDLGPVGTFGMTGRITDEVRAEVVIVSVVEPPAVTVAGLNVATAPSGKPDAEKEIVAGKVPATAVVVNPNDADPPAVTVCVTAVLLKLKSVTLKVVPVDVPPPGAGFTTVIVAAPPAEISDAVTAAVNCVALTKVVVSDVVLNFTTEPLTKFVPFNVNVNAAPPVIADVGESVVIVGTSKPTVSVATEVDDGANPFVLVYAAETECAPAVNPLRVTVATPLTKLADCIVASTVNTTVPVGVIPAPETVALIVTDWPTIGAAGTNGPSTIADAGATDGPAINNCTDAGFESNAFVRLPLNVAVSIGPENVVGVNDAVSTQTPPTVTADGKVPVRVQSVDAAADKPKSAESVWLMEVSCAG